MSQVLDTVVLEDGNELSCAENEWLQSIVYSEEACRHEEIKAAGTRTKIEKVPWTLRQVEENSSCYDPVVVSIGPYHHGKPELVSMEQQKRTMACQYVDGNLNMLQELYKMAKRMAQDARRCYTDKTSVYMFSDEQFARMMFLDGCFILQFIYCIVYNKSNELEMKPNIIAFVQRDLLLLENQIPFQVLKELSIKFGNDQEKKKRLIEFVTQVRGPPLRAEKSFKGRINKLVHINALHWQHEQGITGFEDEPAHLLDLIRTHLFDKSVLNVRPSKQLSDWYSYRSAKELKAVGIHFRPSKTNRLTDVDFKSRFLAGILKLPPLCIDDATESMLLNLLAYEACPDGPDDMGVSSYISLMNSLINNAEDVKELRAKGILLNFLGSDQQVAEFFNRIADNLVPHPNSYAFVKDRIERYYKNKARICVAKCLRSNRKALPFLGRFLFSLVKL